MLSPGPGPGSCLPLCIDLVTEDKISKKPQSEEEDHKDDEVQVEFGIEHVQFLQDSIRPLEVAHVLLLTVEVHAVQTIDGKDHPLEPIPGRGYRSAAGVINTLVVLGHRWTGSVPHVGDVGDPLQVPRDGVEADEEP